MTGPAAPAAPPAAPTARVRRRKIANVLAGEPWVYPNAVLDGPATAGLARIETEDGQMMGWADWNPASAVRARLLTREADWPGDDAWLLQRLQVSIERRFRLGFTLNASAVRLVNGEGDGLPGLVVDAYGTAIILDFYSSGMLARAEVIERILSSQFKDYRFYRRMGDDAARREGATAVEPAEGRIEFGENGIVFTLPIGSGHKTGFYLDQRDNRRMVARWAGGRKVLDLFSYHGAFSLSCLAAGARSALAVDSSQPALDAAMANAQRNGLALSTCKADVFDALPGLAEHGPFDLIICDPPKLAPRKDDRNKAISAYRHLCRCSLGLLAPGGVLLVSSCSQAVNAEDLRQVLAQVAVRSHLAIDVVAMTFQPPDHPWPVAFTTGRYLSSVAVSLRGQP